MHEDETVTWIFGGLALWVAYQWYQSYTAAQAALLVTAPITVISPVPYESAVNVPGALLNSTIY